MSWETVKIITGDTVKTLTAIDKNVQVATLGPSIHDAQYGLKEVLGETLYALLEAADPVVQICLAIPFAGPLSNCFQIVEARQLFFA